MAVWKHRGATAEDLARCMETSLGMIRKLAMLLSRTAPPYVQRRIFSKSTSTAGTRKTISFTRYYLMEESFAQWPRDGVFLLDATLLLKDQSEDELACRCPNVIKDVQVDENGTIDINQFKQHLKAHHGYTDIMFEQDWDFFIPRRYVLQYGDRFSPGIRIDAEEQFLLLLRQHYNPCVKATGTTL